ncbi:putative transferase [Helianthus anomalus]
MCGCTEVTTYSQPEAPLLFFSKSLKISLALIVRFWCVAQCSCHCDCHCHRHFILSNFVPLNVLVISIILAYVLYADVRLAKRIRRDTTEKGREIGMVLDQYSKFVKPSFENFILPAKKYADIIIPRGGDNHVAIDLIVQLIRTKLGQHDLCKIYPNLYVIHSTFQIRGLHTLIRDAKTTKHDFVFFYSERLIRLVVEHGLGHLPFTEKQVTTPTGSVYTGVDFCKRLCGVSVIRSGESMENALRSCCKGIKIGKIFIHRERGDNGQQLFKMKFTKLGSKPDLFPSNGENTRSVCHHFLWITHLLIPII